MQWLDQYAFKAEERIDGDPLLARKVYESLASRLIKNGTGAVVLFGTIQENTKCAHFERTISSPNRVDITIQPYSSRCHAKRGDSRIRRETFYG